MNLSGKRGESNELNFVILLIVSTPFFNAFSFSSMIKMPHLGSLEIKRALPPLIWPSLRWLFVKFQDKK